MEIINDEKEIVNVKKYIVKDFLTSEAIKTLRTNLIFSGVDIHAVALTSFSKSEGKSTVSFQLAASIAQSGKSVLLLEADLRLGMLSKSLRVPGKVEGLTHYLANKENLNNLIYRTDLSGLYIMFAGMRVVNSSELLGSPRFKDLIEKLKDSFDYIIVDAAPLGQVVDCAVFASCLDGVIMVIDTTNNSYKLERKIKNQLENSGAKILGAVLNRVDVKDQRGYYGKKAPYGYEYSNKKIK